MPIFAKKLTIKAIEKAHPKRGKEQTLTDGSTAGLICRIRASSNGVSKTFYYRYKVPGSNTYTKIHIGAYPETTLDKACAKCYEYATREKNGTLFPHNAKLQFNAHSITLREAATNWIEQTQGSSEHKRTIMNRFKNHIFHELGNIPMTELSVPMVLHTLTKLEKEKKIETAKRIVSDIIAIADRQTRLKTLEYNPFYSLRKHFKKPKAESFKAVSRAELPSLLITLSSANVHIQTMCLIWFQMHTLVRPIEAVRAKITDFDLETRIWKFKNLKKPDDEPHVVPLSKQAMEIINFLINLNGTSEYLFPSLRGKSNHHMSSQTCNNVLKKNGFKNKQHAHAFRALGSTIMNDLGMNWDLVERSLAHKEKSEVRAAYNRAEYIDKRRELHQWWSDFLISNSKGHYPSFIL